MDRSRRRSARPQSRQPLVKKSRDKNLRTSSVVRVHMDEAFILVDNYVDPAKWSPLIFNFRHYYRLAPEELGKTFRADNIAFGCIKQKTGRGFHSTGSV